MINVVGEVFDVINAGISVARGNYTDAALSMSAAVPLAGTVAGIAKIAKSAKKVFKKVTKETEAQSKVFQVRRCNEKGKYTQ